MVNIAKTKHHPRTYEVRGKARIESPYKFSSGRTKGGKRIPIGGDLCAKMLLWSSCTVLLFGLFGLLQTPRPGDTARKNAMTHTIKIPPQSLNDSYLLFILSGRLGKTSYS